MYAYNPRKKSPEELNASLVGQDRWDILNSILKELALGEGENPKQHWIIVGPRGMGKSHLLTLLYHKIKVDKRLSDLWIPVLFPEEIKMASDLPRFLERAAREVLIELENEKNPFADGLRTYIDNSKKHPRQNRPDYLFSVLSEIRRQTGKFILLIIENLQQLLGKKLDLMDQKKLRAYLQTEETLLLIGSATTVFEKLHDHSNPFYHFFRIRRLGDLHFDDIKTLILSNLSSGAPTDLVGKLSESEPRLKAIYAFTGGNPRMAVFLSEILRSEVHEEMLSIMDGILDELTPYFEAIINDTPEHLHDIINCLAAYEPAQSPKDIAEHLEMSQPTVRGYIKQLKDMEYVRIAFTRGKSNFYCLNKYLYRIWYQMRDSSHREETRWLMELLVMLYSKEKFRQVLVIKPDEYHADVLLGNCLIYQYKLEEAEEQFKLAAAKNPMGYVASGVWGSLLLKSISNTRESCVGSMLIHGKCLEKSGDEEGAINVYLSGVEQCLNEGVISIDSLRIYENFILPLSRMLEPRKYVSLLYEHQEPEPFSKDLLLSILLILDKYDFVADQLHSAAREKENTEGRTFYPMPLTLAATEVSILWKIVENKLHEVLRLVDLYALCLNTVMEYDDQETAVSRLALNIFKLQVNRGILSKETGRILEHLQKTGVPFNGILIKISMCINEPDSVQANRYLADHAVKSVVEELRRPAVSGIMWQ